MKSPAWLFTYVESLEIATDGRLRSDCPACNGKNTFSVNDDGVYRMWYCFHADCNVSGRLSLSLTRDKATHAFSRSITPEIKKQDSDSPFEIPDTFVSVSRDVNAELYLRSVNAYDAYLSGAVDVRYDFKQNRAVFLVKKERRIVDAVGRSLDGRNPKWYRYGSSGIPFVCDTGHDICVVVEDCASACALFSHTSALALMGTNLLDTHIETIKRYKRVLVALDKDATDKAINIVRKLSGILPTKLVVLSTDIKNMKKEELDEFIGSYIN